MSVTDYLGGAVFAAVTFGAVGVASALVVRRRLAHLPTVEAVLAFGTLGTVGILLTGFLPGALGILTREGALATAVVGLAITWALLRGRLPSTAREPAPGLPSTRASWAVALVTLGAFSAYVLAFLGANATVATPSYDFNAFHLPGAIRWLQSHSLWTTIEFLPETPVGSYPNSGDLVFLSAILPWENDAFVRLVNLPFLGLTALAVYAIGAELGAPRAAALSFAVAVVSIRVVVVPAIELIKPETIMLAAFATGILFLLRHVRTRRTSDLVVAGLALGVAFGARWNGVSAAAIAIGVFAVGHWLRRHELRATVVAAARVSAIVVLVGGFWLVRNLVATGNPVFPFEVAPLGVSIFDGQREEVHRLSGSTIAEYLDSGRIRDEVLRPAFGLAFGAPGLAVASAAAGASALALALALAPGAVRRLLPSAVAARPEAVRTLALAVGALAIAIVYVNAPASAAGPPGFPSAALVAEASRWATPAMVVAAPLGAWLTGQVGRAALAVQALVAAAVAHGVFKQAASFDLDGPELAWGAAAAAGCILSVGVVLLARRRMTGVPRRGRVAVALVVGTGAALVAGDFAQERFNDRRYRDTDPTLRWVAQKAPSGHRIGFGGRVVGYQPAAALHGPRFGNRVSYAGPLRDGMLRRLRDPAAFLELLRRRRYDLLLLGRDFPPRPQPEEAWARAAGWRVVAESQDLMLLRAPPIRRPS